MHNAVIAASGLKPLVKQLKQLFKPIFVAAFINAYYYLAETSIK